MTGKEASDSAVEIQSDKAYFAAVRERWHKASEVWEGLTLERVTAEDIKAEAELAQGLRRMRLKHTASIEGSAGDMTATLPGFEGISDVPLFTENFLTKV